MKTGWILCHKEIGSYAYTFDSYTSRLSEALVWRSREEARYFKRDDVEKVLHVALDRNGKPKKIIGRG